MTIALEPSDEPATPPHGELEARRMRAVLAQLSAGVLLEDEHRRVVLVNAGFCALFGITVPPQSLVGLDCAALAEQAKANFREPDAFVARMLRVLAGRAPVRGERCAMRDGRVLERDYVPLHMDGVDRGHLWTYRDVTALVQATERVHDLSRFQQQVLDSLPMQLAVFDPELRYRFVSPSAVRSGEMREWLIGKNDLEYATRRGLDPEVPRRRMEMQRQVLETKAAVGFEERIVDRDGRERVFVRTLSPVVDDRQEVLYLLGYGMEVTEERQAQAAALEARDLAEAAARARERFLATMSHEIRTPLNGILGTAHLLRATSLTAQQREYVDASLLSAESLLALVNDILDFARIDAGALPFEELAFRIRELLETVIAATRPLAERNGLELRLAVSPRVPEGVVGDPGRLRQILMNIVANAIKFTEAGCVEVLMDAIPFADGRVGCVIRVVDTGVGIAADQQKRIFEPFVQAKDDTTRRFGGTGLGLAIVRQLVERQGGSVTVESVVGKGSTFTVRIPLRPAPPETLAPAVVTSTEEGPRLDGARVLLVEDNTLNQLVATYLLQHAGAEVVTRENGRAALELLRADQAFNVVLMDVQMPEMDGFEATRRIRDELRLPSHKLPVIALTASALAERRKEALAAGMDAFVMKPFRPSELRTVIARTLGGGTPAYGAPAIVRSVVDDRPPVDRTRLESQCLHRVPLMLRLIGVFLTECPKQVAGIGEALREGRYDDLRAAAHKLRSGSSVLGAMPLFDLLAMIESDHEGGPALAERVTAMERLAEQTIAALEALEREYRASEPSA